MNDRLKKIIFNKLNEDLSHVEIILHNDSLWFIDRENKYWYMEFQKGGKLYWRYQFFAKFFPIFTLKRDEYEPLIKEWVESVLNCGVTTTPLVVVRQLRLVESVLNCGVTTTYWVDGKNWGSVESVLNCGVTTTRSEGFIISSRVESVLNGGVTTTYDDNQRHLKHMESVLNCGVTTTSPNPSNGKFEVESALNGGIKYVISADRTFDDVEMVLNNENK